MIYDIPNILIYVLKKVPIEKNKKILHYCKYYELKVEEDKNVYYEYINEFFDFYVIRKKKNLEDLKTLNNIEESISDKNLDCVIYNNKTFFKDWNIEYEETDEGEYKSYDLFDFNCDIDFAIIHYFKEKIKK